MNLTETKGKEKNTDLILGKEESNKDTTESQGKTTTTR